MLVPDFLADGNAQGLLAEALSGGAAPREAPRVETIHAAGIGPISCAYRTERLGEAELDGDPGRVLLDEHGRPLEILYGVACATAGVLHPDAADLDIARADALAAYHRFLDDEAGFTAERSEPFALQSTIVPALVGIMMPPESDELVEPGSLPPDTAEAPVTPPAVGRSLVVAGVAALAVALAAAAWLFLVRSPDGREVTVEVKSPSAENLECGRSVAVRFEAVLSTDGEEAVTFHWEDQPEDPSASDWTSDRAEVTVGEDGREVRVSRKVRLTAGESLRGSMALVVDQPNRGEGSVEYELSCEEPRGQ